MGLKKLVKKAKRAVKKVSRAAQSVVKVGINTAEKAVKSNIKNVKRLIGLKRSRRGGGGKRQVGVEGTIENIAKLREFTGESKEVEKVTIVDTFSGLCFNGTKSNFDFSSPQCYDFDDNFIHFSSSMSEKYDTDTDEFIDLDLSNAFVDPTKKYPIKTIGTKYVGSGIAGLATGGKTCDDIECEAKPNLCSMNIGIEAESSIIRRTYEFNNITWIRRDDMPEGVAFHTGVGDEDNAIFWGGLHASIEAANLQSHIPGCDNWDDIITSFQGNFYKDGIIDTHLFYSQFRDFTETNYGVTFTPIQNGTQNNNYEIYDQNLVNTFDISGSLQQIDSGKFSLHGGKISYTAYEEDTENIKVYYDSGEIIVPKELYTAKFNNLCNILETGFSQTVTEGVLLVPYMKDDILVNQSVDKNKFTSPVSIPSNVAESEPLEDYWQVLCITGDCLCECDDDAWIQYDFACITKILKYEITVDIQDSPPQFTPKEWILVGSDDPTANKDDWDTIDSREEIDIWSEGTTGYVTKEFEVQSPKNFKHYRIYFDKANYNIIRINQLKFLTYVNPSIWLWSPPYNQSGSQHIVSTEELYIQPSTLVISGSNLEIVRSIKKSGGGARVSRAIMAGIDSTGIGNLYVGLSSGYCENMPFDYGDIKKEIAVEPPNDELITKSFPWNVIGDGGIVGPTGMVEMIDLNGNYWIAYGDSNNKNTSMNKDNDFINKYTIIMISENKIAEFQKSILAYDNFRHSNIQINGFSRKDWTGIEVDKSLGTYISLKGSRNREGFIELINSRIGDKFFDIYVQVLDYNVTDPSNHTYTNKEINNPDPYYGTYDPTLCETINDVCVDNTNYFYFNENSNFYPILLTELVTPKDSNCNCNFCSLEDVMIVDSSGNPLTFEFDDAPSWKQHNHTEWATSYLESPFSGPFSREKFNVWLTAGQDPNWGTALWSTVDKGEGWMHFRKTRFSVDAENNNLTYITICASFNMEKFVGTYTSIPVYVTYDEFIFDLEYYKPLREVQRIIERDSKDFMCDDTLLTYVNPHIFIFCGEPKQIDIDNVFFNEAVSRKNLGRENSIDVDYTQNISGGAGFHSQSPFMIGPIEDDVIIYAGSTDGVPLTISGEFTIVKGVAEVEPSYPFKSEDIVYRSSGGFSISEFGIDTSQISGTDEEIPNEDNENLFDEDIQTAETSGNRITLGQRLILGRYRSSFGMKRSQLNRRYPWVNSFFEKNSPVYADFNSLSDRQRRIVDKYFSGNGLQRAVLLKRHPWLKSIKSSPMTTDAANVVADRLKRSLKRNWRFFRRRQLEVSPPPSETPSITGDNAPIVIDSGTELFTAQKGVVYWIFLGIPDTAENNSFNIYASGKIYYTPLINNVQVDPDPDTGYTEWTTCFIMEYKKREESEDGTERKYYYRYNVEDRESDTLLEKEQVNQTNKNIIETDWRRFQDGVGLGGGSVPILNNRFPTNIKCTNPASCGIGSVAFGDTDQSVICGGYKNDKNGVLIPTRSWWGLTTDMPTFKWNRFVINPEDTLNSNYRKRNFSPFYNDGDQTLTDSIHSCILFDISRPQTFERHGQMLFDNETEKEVLFEDFPEYVEEKDKYSITIVPTGNVKMWWSDKGDNKFTINSEIEWKGTVDWKIIKVADIPIEQIEEMKEEDTFEQYEDQ